VDQDWLMRELGISLHNVKAARKKSIFHVRRIQGLEGKRGWPVPVFFTDLPLDPAARLREYPDPLWGTVARYAADHVPDQLSQTITRVPLLTHSFTWLRSTDEKGFMGWKWICPGCKKTCRTIFYPLPGLFGLGLLGNDPGLPTRNSGSMQDPDAWA